MAAPATAHRERNPMSTCVSANSEADTSDSFVPCNNWHTGKETIVHMCLSANSLSFLCSKIIRYYLLFKTGKEPNLSIETSGSYAYAMTPFSLV